MELSLFALRLSGDNERFLGKARKILLGNKPVNADVAEVIGGALQDVKGEAYASRVVELHALIPLRRSGASTVNLPKANKSQLAKDVCNAIDRQDFEGLVRLAREAPDAKNFVRTESLWNLVCKEPSSPKQVAHIMVALSFLERNGVVAIPQLQQFLRRYRRAIENNIEEVFNEAVGEWAKQGSGPSIHVAKLLHGVFRHRAPGQVLRVLDTVTVDGRNAEELEALRFNLLLRYVPIEESIEGLGRLISHSAAASPLHRNQVALNMLRYHADGNSDVASLYSRCLTEHAPGYSLRLAVALMETASFRALVPKMVDPLLPTVGSEGGSIVNELALQVYALGLDYAPSRIGVLARLLPSVGLSRAQKLRIEALIENRSLRDELRDELLKSGRELGISSVVRRAELYNPWFS